MEKAWKQDMVYLIQEAFDPSLDEDDNYDRVYCDYDPEFTDPSNLEEKDVIELGGSTKFAKRLVEQFDDLSEEKQNQIWCKAEELIKDFGQMLMDEEEDWVRHKIRKLIKAKTV
jgi:hypothetical protein